MDEFSLGMLCLAVVFEPRKNQRCPSLSKRAVFLKQICQETYELIKAKERTHRIYPVSKKPYFHLSGACQAWLSGTAFSKIMRFTDTDEGEIIRYFRMGVQILREINSSKLSSPYLKSKTHEVIRILNRDIVDAEKQLRS